MRVGEHTLNRLAVLKAIRHAGPVARSDLPPATGLSAGSITKLTAELLGRGLIRETRHTSKRAGRPRLLLEIAADGAVVIGASITGRNKVTAAFVDLAGRPLFSTDIPYNPPSSLADQAEQIAAALAEALARSPVAKAAVKRVGIAVPGIVDSLRGEVHFVTTLPPGPVPMAQIISDRLGLPTTIENELASMARAEHWFGQAQDLETFTMVHVGYSTGAAEYADGVPKVGTSGLNLELAHVKTDYGPDARPCICGTRGCMMMYCSMFGMVQAAGLLAGARFPPLDSLEVQFAALMDRSASSDAEACEVVSSAAEHLGRALADLLAMSSPATLVVSVLSPRLLGDFQARVEGALRAYAPPPVLRGTQIRYIVADPNWRWTGTAALALEQTYLGAG